MRSNFKTNRGFTLIEIIIAIAVASIVIMIGYSIINSTNSLFTSQTSKVDARDDVRMVLNQIAKDIEQSSSFTFGSPYVFTLGNGNKVSYFYDSTKKAVVKQVNGGAPSVMLQNVSNTFNIVEIPPAGSNTFSITLEAVSKSYAVGKTDLENYNMTVVRRQRDGIVSPGIMLQSGIFTNRTITVSFTDNSIIGLTKDDFIVTATINGVPVSISNLTYDAATRTFEFTPFPPTSVNQNLVLTVTTNSTKVYGGPISSQPITIYAATSTSPGGLPYGDVSRDWFTGGDTNLDFVNGTIEYEGTGNLVIPYDYPYIAEAGKDADNINVLAKDGIIIQSKVFPEENTLDTHNNGKYINLSTNIYTDPTIETGKYGIDVENVTLNGQSINIETKGDICIQSTRFVIAKGSQGKITLWTPGKIYYNDQTKIFDDNGREYPFIVNGYLNSDVIIRQGTLVYSNIMHYSFK